MEDKVQKLIKKHKKDKDLTKEKIESGWDWSGACLSGFNLEGLTLSSSFRNLGVIIKERESNFERVNFEGANLKKVIIDGANLKNANFFRANLQKASLCYSDLTEANLYYAILDEANFSFSKLDKAILSNTLLWRTSFDHASLENIKLYNTNIEHATGLESSIFKKIDESDVQEAVKVYLALERYFKLNDCPDQAGIYYYRRKVLRRKIQPQPHRFFSHLFDWLCGYGEKPFRVVAWAIFIIWIFGLLYFIGGGPSGKVTNSFWDSFYFSGMTFTTFGFGDLFPNPSDIIMKIVTLVEAFAGAFLIPLFIVSLTRKLMR